MNTYNERIETRRQRYADLANKKRTEASRLYKSGNDALSVIPFGQPILVGHHSERADRSYRARAVGKIDKSFAMDGVADYYEQKAESYGSHGISSDDPEATTKLEEKLLQLETAQNKMREENIMARHKYLPQPYARYQLSNNNANIHRVKQRISELKTAKDMVKNDPIKGPDWEVRESTEDNRIHFIFLGKPSEEIRNTLKRNGFRWSPSRKAWVRQLNATGRAAVTRIVQTL